MKTAQDIILRPIVTEESMKNMQQKKYTFRVAMDATKIEIAQAAEALFGVCLLYTSRRQLPFSSRPQYIGSFGRQAVFRARAGRRDAGLWKGSRADGVAYP